MIAKRIPHKTQCDHAQTPYARRKCRAAKLAAAQVAQKEPQMRYTVQLTAGIYTVLHDGKPLGSAFSSPDEQVAQRMAANLNANSQTAKVADPAPTSQMRPGWSKAAKRRGGRTGRSHPLGRVVEAGSGYTVYEDDMFGGNVQIWDES